MVFVCVMLGLVIIAAMVYTAFNKKSSSHVRVASLIALGVMILTIIICLILIFTDNTAPVDPSVLIVGAPAPVTEKDDSGIFVLILLIAFLIGIFALVAIMVMRENRKEVKKTKPAEKEFNPYEDDFKF